MTNDIDPDLPIRLAGIIPIMFPLGGMTPSGLRKEAVRGRLVLNAADLRLAEGSFGAGGGSGTRAEYVFVDRPHAR